MTKVLQQSAFPDRAAYVEHNIRHQSALLVESLQRYLATPTFRSYPPPPPPPPPQQPPESPKPSDFGIDLEAGDLNFSNEDPEVLENFDFDSFLHNTDAGQPFESFDFMNISLETEKPATEDPRSRTISPEPMEVRPQPTAKELPKKCQPCRARRIEVISAHDPFPAQRLRSNHSVISCSKDHLAQIAGKTTFSVRSL